MGTVIEYPLSRLLELHVVVMVVVVKSLYGSCNRILSVSKLHTALFFLLWNVPLGMHSCFGVRHVRSSHTHTHTYKQPRGTKNTNTDIMRQNLHMSNRLEVLQC